MELDSGGARTMGEIDFFELSTGGARHWWGPELEQLWKLVRLEEPDIGGIRHWWDQTLVEPELERFGKLVRLGVRSRETLESSETEEPLRLVELHAAGGKHW